MNRVSSLWVASISVSIILLTLLLVFVDLPALGKALGSVSMPLIALALFPLTAEALITSLRIARCANRPIPFGRAVYCNAWYVLWLSVLPARLGEVAAISLFKRQLGMTTGSAIASIVVQRIYDLIILCGLLLIFLSGQILEDHVAFWVAAGGLVALGLVLTTLPFWLATAAKCTYRWRNRSKLLRALIHMSFQARDWYRHHQSRSAVMWLGVTTTAKWLVNLVTVVLIFKACQIQLDTGVLCILAILIHFLGAIPIQSIGGFGVVEIGLAGLLISFGVSAPDAVATGLVLRLVALGYAGLFFLASFAALRKA